MTTDYKNKLFAVYGDSISTLQGCSLPHGAAFYEGARAREAGVLTVADTWWGKVIAALGGRLLINHSISGSTVCCLPAYEIPAYGCSSERIAALCQAGQTPDVVMVLLGINDWGHGIAPLPRAASEAENPFIFSVAYRHMLTGLRAACPQAELWCLTLPISCCTRRAGFTFPYRYGGRHIEEYNEIIRATAQACGARLLDLYRAEQPHDTLDGFHPTAQGMQTLADNLLAML